MTHFNSGFISHEQFWLRRSIIHWMMICILVVSYISCTSGEKKPTAAELARENFLQAKEKDPYRFEKYCNERFGYCIGYPVFILFPLPETANGDGRIFLNDQKKEVLRVFGTFNSFKQYGRAAIAMQFQKDLTEIENAGNIKIVNKVLTDDHYQITGMAGTKYFVQKVILKKESFAYAILQYDLADNSELEKISPKILAEFK